MFRLFKIFKKERNVTPATQDNSHHHHTSTLETKTQSKGEAVLNAIKNSMLEDGRWHVRKKTLEVLCIVDDTETKFIEVVCLYLIDMYTDWSVRINIHPPSYAYLVSPLQTKEEKWEDLEVGGWEVERLFRHIDRSTIKCSNNPLHFPQEEELRGLCEYWYKNVQTPAHEKFVKLSKEGEVQYLTNLYVDTGKNSENSEGA